VKEAAKYLAHVKSLVILHPRVAHWAILREEVEGDLGLFRYRLVLDDDSLLETFERFQLVAGEVQVTKFSFHWQSAEGQLYKRWKRDSMGHYLVTGCAGFLDITNRNSPLVSVG
jgi:hypothetical protein